MQVEDDDGDEKDGMDESIFPADVMQHGCLLDDLIHELLVRPLPAGQWRGCARGAGAPTAQLLRGRGCCAGGRGGLTPPKPWLLRSGAQLVAFIDASNSGTLLDLPYTTRLGRDESGALSIAWDEDDDAQAAGKVGAAGWQAGVRGMSGAAVAGFCRLGWRLR
jgi:hypothetical protein